MGYPFDKKVKLLAEFISEQLVEIKPIWDKIKENIELMNRERRFLVHGFISYGLPNEDTPTYIKEKGQVTQKKQNTNDILKLTDKLHHLNTGDNGINGEFNTLFTKLRIDKWNKFVNDDHKILYRLNGNIISEWKG